jgi:Mn2+/Fe2+ NRAMP family transporter
MAPRFYGVIAVSVVVGLALNYAGLSAVKMLFWSAVLNGILAPPLVVLVVLLTSDKRLWESAPMLAARECWVGSALPS